MTQVIKQRKVNVTTTETIPTLEVAKVFKSKTQQSIENNFTKLSSEMLEKINSMPQVPVNSDILESLQSEYLEIPDKSMMTVRMNCKTQLKDTNKILCSIVSSDEDLGGLLLYVKEYKNDDSSFIVCVENSSLERQSFWINCVVFQ